MTASGGPVRVRPGHTLQRRFWHVAGGLVLIAPYALEWVERRRYALCLAGFLTVLLALDIVRLRRPAVNVLFTRVLKDLLLPRDLTGLNGTTYYVAGILSAVLLVPRAQAVAGALCLILGDFAAGVVGRAWGRTRPLLRSKSLEGSTACLVVSLAAALPLVGWPAAAGGALAATVVEFTELPLDDNLLIPPISGAVMLWLA